MVLSLKSRHLSIRQRIPELTASGKNQRKSNKSYVCKFQRERKSTRILQKILIVLHAVLAFFREMSRYQRLFLLHHSAFWFRIQGAEEAQEHAIPSANRRTTVSIRPRPRRPQIRMHKR